MQRFIAREPYTFTNDSIGWRSGGPLDCLGPYAKVQRCPIAGTTLRRTAYATGYADTYFSIPACTRVRGIYLRGFFASPGINEPGHGEDAIVFYPEGQFREKLWAVCQPGEIIDRIRS